MLEILASLIHLSVFFFVFMCSPDTLASHILLRVAFTELHLMKCCFSDISRAYEMSKYKLIIFSDVMFKRKTKP